MEFELNFFEYKKNCNEYKVLVKAISENATRKEIKEGQSLFDLIFKNIEIIDIRLFQIESSITNRTVEIKGTEGRKYFNSHKVEIKYNNNDRNNFENKLFIGYPSELGIENYYLEEIQPHIKKIRIFLESSFDHSDYLKEIQNRESDMKKGIDDPMERQLLHFKKKPIEHSIDEVLGYYSNRSNKLKEYLRLFLVQKRY